MTNLKTILTLAAVASLTAALAPTSASAFFGRLGGGNHTAHIGGNHPANGGGGHSVNVGVGHPVKLGGGFRPSIHAGWHPTVSSNPAWHRQYGWHDHQRPVEVNVVDGYARPHYAAAPTYPARPQAAVNGQNVVLVEVPNAQFSMVAPGQWVKQGANGEHFEFTEDNRDEWSVYLTDASRGVSLQLDLFQKQVYFLGAQPKRAVFPIVNVSAVRRG